MSVSYKILIFVRRSLFSCCVISGFLLFPLETAYSQTVGVQDKALLKAGAAAKKAKDFSLAFKHYQAAATLGNAEAMREIGTFFEDGTGVRQDYALAMRWYQQAAKKGLSDAMNDIGTLFDKGLGVEKDSCKADSWYRKSIDADKENSYALRNLGFNLWKGHCQQDYWTGKILLGRAKNLGNSQAAEDLANMNSAECSGYVDRLTGMDYRKCGQPSN